MQLLLSGSGDVHIHEEYIECTTGLAMLGEQIEGRLAITCTGEPAPGDANEISGDDKKDSGDDEVNDFNGRPAKRVKFEGTEFFIPVGTRLVKDTDWPIKTKINIDASSISGIEVNGKVTLHVSALLALNLCLIVNAEGSVRFSAAQEFRNLTLINSGRGYINCNHSSAADVLAVAMGSGDIDNFHVIATGQLVAGRDASISGTKRGYADIKVQLGACSIPPALD
jgi:hypothetical protein